MENELNELEQSSTGILDFLEAPIVLGDTILPVNLREILLNFLLPFLGILVLSIIFHSLFLRLINKSELSEKPKTVVSRVNKWIFTLTPIIAFILLLANLFGAEIFQFLQSIFDLFSEPLYSTEGIQISLITILALIPIFYIASWMGKVTRAFFENTILKRLKIDEAKSFSILKLIRYSSMSIVVLIGLSIVGINLSSLFVIFGVLGIGIGFGLQTVIANLFAGIVIIFSRPIKEGDFIQVESAHMSYEGTVKQIHLLNSTVLTLKNETLIIPNSSMINNAVHNNSFNDPAVIVSGMVSIAYETDVERALAILMAVCLENPYALNEKLKRTHGAEPVVRLKEFAASSIDLEARFWISPAATKLEALAWFNLEIWRRFKKEGLSFPFPQLDVHLDRKKEGK